MEHTSNHRPVVGMAAVMTAGAVLLAPTTTPPPKPPVTLSAPQISTQEVHLVALPSFLDIAPRTAAAASAGPIGAGNVVNRLLTGIYTGAGAGALSGFVIGGLLALNTVGRIPVLGRLVTPAVAISGAIVGIPIGAVVGLFGSFRSPSPSLSAASIRSAVAKRVLRSDRHQSSPPAPGEAAVSHARRTTPRAVDQH